MKSVLGTVLAAVTILGAGVACGGGVAGQLPTAPTARPEPSPPVVSPNAVPISVGQTVSRRVQLSDATCETGFPTDPREPCQRFAIAIATPGILSVQVTSSGPSELALRFGSGGATYGVNTLAAAAPVRAGWTYEVSVALHHAVNGNVDQTFQLTTSLIDDH